jgi:hypothetical protein
VRVESLSPPHNTKVTKNTEREGHEEYLARRARRI